MGRKAVENLEKPTISVGIEQLEGAGFITSGKKKYTSIVQGFSDELFVKSIRYCDAASGGYEREVSADNVISAMRKIYSTPIVRHKKFSVILQILEYLLSVGIGVGASNIKETWGIIMCMSCFIFTCVSFIFRKMNEHE